MPFDLSPDIQHMIKHGSESFTRNAAAVTAASLKGQTLLPLPTVTLQTLEGSSLGSNIKLSHKQREELYVLEAVVLTWSRQIKSALHSPALENPSVSQVLELCHAKCRWSISLMWKLPIPCIA